LGTAAAFFAASLKRVCSLSRSSTHDFASVSALANAFQRSSEKSSGRTQGLL
jgi:hypothetical protein